MNLLDIATCAQQGWFGHVGVHEAGHATAAIVLEFEFIDVSINSGQNTLAQMTPGARVEAGGLRPQPTSLRSGSVRARKTH